MDNPYPNPETGVLQDGLNKGWNEGHASRDPEVADLVDALEIAVEALRKDYPDNSLLMMSILPVLEEKKDVSV